MKKVPELRPRFCLSVCVCVCSVCFIIVTMCISTRRYFAFFSDISSTFDKCI